MNEKFKYSNIIYIFRINSKGIFKINSKGRMINIHRGYYIKNYSN